MDASLAKIDNIAAICDTCSRERFVYTGKAIKRMAYADQLLQLYEQQTPEYLVQANVYQNLTTLLNIDQADVARCHESTSAVLHSREQRWAKIMPRH